MEADRAEGRLTGPVEELMVGQLIGKLTVGGRHVRLSGLWKTDSWSWVGVKRAAECRGGGEGGNVVSRRLGEGLVWMAW